jgi:cytoskeletal protein RodZ
MDEIKTLKEILKEEMRAKGLTAEKLAEIAEIAPKYINALIDSDFGNLPPAPYVRGYLKKIADALEIDFDMLWHYYDREARIARSGRNDMLPTNRYAIKPVNKARLAVGAVAVIALAYFFPILVDFFGRPSLEIVAPAQDQIVVSSQDYMLEGRVKRAQDRVYINDTEIDVQQDGAFSKQVFLDEGKNTYVFRAKRFLGREMSVTRNIFYKPSSSEPLMEPGNGPATTTSSLPGQSPQATPAE